MSEKIRVIVCTIIFLFLSVFLSSSSKAACWLWGNDCGYLFSHYESSYAYPIPTTFSGGPNSVDNPLIGVHIKRCSNCDYDRYNLVLKPGEIKAPTGSPSVYKYHAEIRTVTQACNNKCIYANACPADILKIPPLNQCPGGGSSVACDPQVSSLAINMCNRSTHVPPAALGMCVYKSNKTGYEQFFSDLWNSIKNLGPKILNPVSTMIDFLKDPSSITSPSNTDSSLIGCFPIPAAPLPYPFCKIPIKTYSPLTVFRMCEVGEFPYCTLSGSTKECIYPAPATPNMQSTFMSPCVRVSYETPVANKFITGNSTHNNLYNIDYTKYYSGQGKNYELLYTNNSPPATQFANPNTKVRSSILYNDDADNGTTIPLTFFGYNNANYIDLCGTINTIDGSIDITNPNILIDQFGNTRTLKLAICKDPATGANICNDSQGKFSPEKAFLQKNVCVFTLTSSGAEVFQGCVQRPKLPKPSVSFCDGNFNDRSNSCMNVKGTLGQEYQFKGNTTTCTYSQSAPEPELCTLRNSTPQNPFGFQPILTNRCYINTISIDQHTQADKYICYKNEPNCNTQRTSSGDCSNCDVDEYCAELDTSRSIPFAKKVVGAERLCLYGYTDGYTELSEPWCKDGTKPCNRVCANTYSRPDGQQMIPTAYVDIGSRTMPTPATVSPLISPSCAYSHVTSQNQAKYRVRNPVEEGLCVDAYTIKFNKECVPQDSDPYFNKNLCSKIKIFCSETDNQKQHYINFEECQAMFKTCLSITPPTTKQTLRNGTIYTCDDIQTFATISDTFKKAKPPPEPTPPSKQN